MSFRYGVDSTGVLVTLHPTLRKLVTAVLESRDHKLLRGVRTVAKQKQYVKDGWSKTMDSRHLPGGGIEVQDPEFPELSYAVDLAPWIKGAKVTREKELAFFMGYVQAKADELGVHLRWGGDWDSDGDQAEHAFWDGVHIELQRGLY